ncbi:MAG TPA: flagellar hook-associated protein FlgL [Bacteroidota bacterium]|nr:flagellar hook-associated protein FlgL [Bacteroidota bacterium]
MRITDKAMSDNFMSSVNQARERIVDLQTKIATGKSVQKPSDDPRATNAILRLQASLASNSQYSDNVADGSGVAQATSQTLDQFSSIFLQLKDIVTRASNPTMQGEYTTYAQQVDQLLSEAINSANTKFDGKYIFGGTQTTDPPYTLASDRMSVAKNPNGIDGTINYAVGDGLTQQVNIPGEEAFQGKGLFDLLIQVRDTLNSGSAPQTAQVDAVNSGYDHIVMEGSKAGAFVQNMDNLSTHLDDQKTQLTQFLSNEQDSDLAQSVTTLKQEETMLEAALNTGAQTIPKTLLDFLQSA